MQSDDLVHGGEERLQFQVVFAQGFFRPLAGGHVHVVAAVAAEGSVGGHQRQARRRHPHGLAIPGDDGVLEVDERFAAGERGQRGLAELLAAGFGMQVVEMHFADQFPGTVAVDGFRDGAGIGVYPLRIDFPRNGAALGGEFQEAAFAGFQFRLPGAQAPAAGGEFGGQPRQQEGGGS